MQRRSIPGLWKLGLLSRMMLMPLLQKKWGKPHKGKVLLCHPEGDAHPHLQLQTGSGQVVSTARVRMTLKPQVSSYCINDDLCT